MVNWAHCRLFVICTVICIGTGLPFFCTLYIPNTAQNSMQKFLYDSILWDGNATNLTLEEAHEARRHDVKLSLLWSVFIAEMAMGQLVGYIVASPLVDGIGRKHSLLLASMLMIPAQLCHILAQPLSAWPLLYIARLATMLIFAVTSVIVPVFLSEVSIASSRGTLGIIFPLSLSTGALLGGILGLNSVLGSENLWPVAFVVPLFFSVLILPLICYLPETPQFLAAAGDLPASRKALIFYQGTDENFEAIQVDSHMSGCSPLQSPLAEEMEQLRKPRRFRRKPPLNRNHSGVSNRSLMAKSSFSAMGRLLGKQSLRGPLLLTIVIGVSFCSSGILVVSAYSTAIMRNSGISWHRAEYLTVGLKVLSFATYILCLYLVDRVGRRPLILTSILGSACAWTCMVAAHWLSEPIKAIACPVVLYVAQFFMNVGIRPLFYVLVPELFPFEFRTAGKSLVALLGVILSLPILFGFWPLLKLLGEFVFLFQAVPLWCCLLYLYKSCPETKGRSPAEIFQNIRVGSIKENPIPGI